MGLLDDLGDIAGDVVDGVVDAVEAVVDTAGDIVDGVGEGLADVGDVIIDIGEYTVEGLDAGLTLFEEVGFFDVVDYATIGLVDIQYDAAGFSLDLGIEDVIGYGISIGENGVSFEADYIGSGFEVAVGSDGFSASASLGIDWGPLPSAGASVAVDEEGQLGVDGRAEVYIPHPAGLSGGEIEGSYQETADGFRVEGSLTGRHYAPSGTYAGAGVHASHERFADGYSTTVGVHGEVGQLGGPEVRASLDYTEGRTGDVETSGVRVSAEGEVAPGFEAGTSISYTHVETPEGELDIVSGTAVVRGAGAHVAAEATVVDRPGGLSIDGDADVDLGRDPLGLAKSAADAAGLDFPDLPELPDVPRLPDVAKSAGDAAGVEIPDLPDVPRLPDVARTAARTAGLDIPDLPDLPELPDLPRPPDLAEAPEPPRRGSEEAVDEVLSQDLSNPTDDLG